MKKGQGISINVVVIAAIALLVLVILATLVLTTGKKTTAGSSCEGTGGRCFSESFFAGGCPDDFPNKDLGSSCAKSAAGEAQVCCRNIVG